MHTRYRSSLVALALLALTSATPPAAAAQDATPTDAAQQAADAQLQAACGAPVAPGTPLTIKGKGRVQTAPFTLEGGAYTVDWSATDVSGVTLIYLQSPTEPVLESLMKGSGKDDKSGQTHIYKVKPGSYYLNVALPAGWSVTFTPLAV
jgi:hypothetical protein